jgi:hypothetical protein
MDPLGFALDNFDAVGRWRERDRFTGTEIDSSGTLPDGEIVTGPEDLRQAIIKRPRMFAEILTERLMAYALGRDIEASDMPIVRSIIRDAAEDDYRFGTIVLNIVNSYPFRMKAAPEVSSSEDNESSDLALSQ